MIKEVLDCVDSAMMELEYVAIRDLPEEIRQDFIQAHTLLVHIGSVLEMELEMEGYDD